MLNIPNNVKMLVFDMAGTVIQESGIVYKTLYDTMKHYNMNVTEDKLKKWHGLDKYDVLDKQLSLEKKNDKCSYLTRDQLFSEFSIRLRDNYKDNVNVDPKIIDLFQDIRSSGIKIALNSGYPKDIQEELIYDNRLDVCIDDYICGEDVFKGRPYPFMIYSLAQRNYTIPANVIKIGDTRNDILEGLNSQCMKSVGVLSGIDDEETLINAGATDIIDSVLDIKIS